MLARWAWGNRWSASCDYIQICNRVLLADAPVNVLECGSGLTTVFSALLGAKNGFDVYALEEDEGWLTRVRSGIPGTAVAAVHLLSTPLRSYGDFDWYDVADVELPSFQVVICDGPRGRTRGGRYGLVPVMASKISDAKILLDDASRQGEQAVLTRWVDEHGADVDLNRESERGLAVVHLPRSSV